MSPEAIPIAVTARNEERSLGACLASLRASIESAAPRTARPLHLVAVLDDTTDGSEAIARAAGAEVLRSSGGLVAAQRRAVLAFPRAPFHVFADADVSVEPPTLGAMVALLDQEPDLRVCYPPKLPLPARRKTLLARALYSYNYNQGLQTKRHFFSGKLFAMRGWAVPDQQEMAERAARLPDDRFYDYRAGMRVDDIYLSRRVFVESGPRAIAETAEGRLWFRPPETFEGMYRTYRRMRMEIERLDALFPETRDAHERWGIRRTDRRAVAAANAEERYLHRVFHAALALCKARYRAERFAYRHCFRERCDPWAPIAETKAPIGPAEPPTA